MVRACTSCVPWEKLRRATSIPASIRFPNRWGDSVEGPTVHMIFVRRGLGFESRMARSSIAEHGTRLKLPKSSLLFRLRMAVE